MAMKPAWTSGGRSGEMRRHKEQVFFAIEGLIALNDERPDKQDYSVLLPGDFENRATSLAQFAAKCTADDRPWMRAEGKMMQRAAQDMMETVKEARFMGDPSDPAVRAFWALHRNRKSTVSLHAGVDVAGYPDLPEMPLGPVTGKKAESGTKMNTAVADDAHLRLHRQPRKKSRGPGLVLDL